ncbi:phospholipase [Pistricoccus aurantiacus]|uniref:phospholipase D n=2 Tax=Pistricoccus aurantiacus TaxID=1883414 RepID=A0A5B8SVD4_9GAMM|nr:phospholipase D family protein [Pistricoccus aurantiacus]QEA40929.1 phospholipase [Pistricoccus aurantiacus]
MGWKGLLLLLVIVYLAMAFWQRYKPLPEGIGMASPLYPATNLAFLADETYLDAQGNRQSDQAIFDEVLRLIGQAERLIVLDMFLFNAFKGEAEGHYRPLSHQLTQALIERKQAMPEIEAVVISDPLNTLYGGLASAHFQALREAGVKVIMTDLTEQRASNPAWSGLWYLCCRWLGNSAEDGWLPNLLGSGRVTLRSYLALLNFNANHRKTLVVDEGQYWTGMVTSANPHDASSWHDNVALRFSGPAVGDLLKSERAVADYSGGAVDFPRLNFAVPEEAGEARLQILTEGGIGDALLETLNESKAGDKIDIAVFYLAHREIMTALIAAHRRGVELRVLLDPNRDAFGIKKNGIPNRQAGWELHRAGVPLRWCDTHGEQCHSKMLLYQPDSGPVELILGSANYTRRNLDDLNLETSVQLVAPRETPATRQALALFERQWNNPDGRRYSLDYATFADPSRWRYWQYRLMEATGLSTF